MNAGRANAAASRALEGGRQAGARPLLLRRLAWMCMSTKERGAWLRTPPQPRRPAARAPRSQRARGAGSMTCRNISTGNACRQRSLCRTWPPRTGAPWEGQRAGHPRGPHVDTGAGSLHCSLPVQHDELLSSPSSAARLPGMPRSAGTRIVLVRPGARAPILPCAQPHGGLDTWQCARRACRC